MEVTAAPGGPWLTGPNRRDGHFCIRSNHWMLSERTTSTGKQFDQWCGEGGSRSYKKAEGRQIRKVPIQRETGTTPPQQKSLCGHLSVRSRWVCNGQQRQRSQGLTTFVERPSDNPPNERSKWRIDISGGCCRFSDSVDVCLHRCQHRGHRRPQTATTGPIRRKEADARQPGLGSPFLSEAHTRRLSEITHFAFLRCCCAATFSATTTTWIRRAHLSRKKQESSKYTLAVGKKLLKGKKEGSPLEVPDHFIACRQPRVTLCSATGNARIPLAAATKYKRYAYAEFVQLRANLSAKDSSDRRHRPLPYPDIQQWYSRDIIKN